MSQQTESADMGGAEYASLEDVAAERGEEPAKLARQLIRRGCDLWLWFDGSKEYRSGEYESKHGSGWGYPRECISPGHYRLAPEASTEAIRRIAVDDFSVAGLVLVFEFAPDDTLSIRMAEDDATVCVVVNPADLSQLPPPPSEDMGASGSGHPTMRGGKNSENFSEKSIGRTSPITIFIDEQIDKGVQEWQEAWSTLREWADAKNTKPEEMTLRFLGERSVNLRRSMAQTSKGTDHAVDYQEEDWPIPKTISRQDFGRMFREALKKSRS